jgi:hypothetical protein
MIKCEKCRFSRLTGMRRHLKPGGYMEQVEISVVPKSEDGSINGTILEKWGVVSLQAGDAFGKTLRIVDEAKDRMIAAGFVDVVERRFKLPIGPWPKDRHMQELGLYNRLYWEEGIQGWTMMLLTNILKACIPSFDKLFMNMANSPYN